MEPTPGRRRFRNSSVEHKEEPAVRGEASEGIAFVYYPRSNRGIWYQRIGEAFAVGLLDETALKVLSEIVSETGRF